MGWLADETGLEKCAANYVALTPLSFLKRAADIHADRSRDYRALGGYDAD